MTLRGLRRQVDRVDDDLVLLLNRRAALACEIGRIKRASGLSVYDPKREAEVLDRAKASTTDLNGPLDGHAIVRVFERIIDEARRLEIEERKGREAHGCSHGRTRVGRASRAGRRPAR